MRSNSTVGAWVLIILGVYFLLLKQGWLPGLAPLIAEWWPLILIGIGVALLLRRTARRDPKL